MKLGVAYYPEHCEPSQWSLDYEKIRSAGIKRIRIAEFAWSSLEPDKGEFNWEWLDKSIELAEVFGIEVVLCTPTACPPVWLVTEFPDILPVNEEGRRDSFGGRHHRCFNAPEYLRHAYKIVELMAERYGNHPNVVAWQIDNELGAEQKWCYCPHCDTAFQEYLKKKYNAIEDLNRRWGTHFWSQDYQRFSQIETPKKCANQIFVKPHPSLKLDFLRFSSDTIINFCRKQTSIIKKYSPGRPVTTNMYNFRWGDNLNWCELVRELDVAAVDLYSDKPEEVSFYADFVYGLKEGSAWFTEYGPNINNLDEIANLMKYRGIDWLIFYKLKPFPWGQEMEKKKHMLTITGQFTKYYYNIKKWSEDNEKNKNQHPTKFSGLGLYFDFDSSWAYHVASWLDYNPHIFYDERLTYQYNLVEVIYPAIFKADQRIRIVTSKEQIKDLDILVMPLKIIYESGLESALIDFVRKGGKLIVTSDFFKKNADNNYLSSVPEIYKHIFGENCNDFVYIEHLEKELIIKETSLVKGKIIMVREDMTKDEWKQIAKVFINVCTTEIN